MSEEIEPCNLAVVGSGPGGYAAALAAARKGLSVRLIERNAWGGVCLNVGCIPTKALLAVSHFLRKLDQAESMGVELDGYRVNFSKVKTRMEGIVDDLRKGLLGLLKQDGVQLIQGSARFLNPNTLEITHEGVSRKLKADHVIIASGARPSAGPWSFDEERLVSYKGLLALDERPDSLLIIGGGAIGCEFASCFAAFGTKVTLIEQEAQLLPGEDPDAVRWLSRRLTQQGVSVRVRTRVEDLTIQESHVRAAIAGSDTLEVERCLIAIGLVPNVEGMDLEKAGVVYERDGITVDDTLRTQNPNIAAIGDCLPRHGLAHWASAEGVLAVKNLTGEVSDALIESEVPRCVYTDPEIAHIGPNAVALKDTVRVSRFSFGALGRSHCEGDTEGFVKLFVDTKTEALRAATIVASNASSLIHHAVLAIRHGLSARQLAETITAHPTTPESITEAAAMLYGESLVVSAKLKPRARPVGPPL